MTQISEIKKDDINGKQITLDSADIAANASINGWTVGKKVAVMGPNNNALNGSISKIDARTIILPDSTPVGVKNVVRLIANSDTGNVYHSFQATAGQQYTFTWYHLGDYYKSGDTVAKNPEYHVHFTQTYPPVSLASDALSSKFFASDMEWRKQSFSVTASQTGTWYVSFQGVKKESIDRGALITLIKGYVGAEDTGTEADVFRVTGPKVLQLKSKSGQQLENEQWKFSLQQNVSGAWGAPQDAHTLRFEVEKGEGLSFGDDATGWNKALSRGNSNVTIPKSTLLAEKPEEDSTRSMKVGFWSDSTFSQITNVGYEDGGFKHYTPQDGTLPVTLIASVADAWTVEGDVPKSVSEATVLKLQLKNHTKSLTAPEKLGVRLNPGTYLNVSPTEVNTDADGKFTLTVSPTSGQTGTNNTTLSLAHNNIDISPSYTIATGALVPKYDIRVFDQGGELINSAGTVYWDENSEHYVTVWVVEHGSTTLANADISVSSDNTVLSVQGKQPFQSSITTKALTVYLEPNGGGSAMLTFRASGASEVKIGVRLGKGSVKSLIVSHKELWLSPGYTASDEGVESPLEVSFNPRIVTGEGSPPAIHYAITGTGLGIIDNSTNKILLHGEATTKGPNYTFLPRLKTDPSASKPCEITFSTVEGGYTPVTVAVHISSADHVKWNLPGTVNVDAGTTTNLGIKLKVFDGNENMLSAFALNVVIDSMGTQGAHFAGSTSDISHPVTHADREGWVSIPELVVKNVSGTFTLHVEHPGENTFLAKNLTFNVIPAEVPDRITLHPLNDPTISYGRVIKGISGSDYYAELGTPSGKPARHGEITFTLIDGSAKPRFRDSVENHLTVPVNTLDGSALMPTIMVEEQGTFSVQASYEGLVTPQLKFTIT